jgi:hypothetical protein
MSRTKKQANWRYLAGELGLGDELPISLNNENHKFGWSVEVIEREESLVAAA